MARYLLMMLIFAMTSLIASAQTSLSGKVTEEESGEPVLFGSVALYKNGNLITGTDTDLDGNFIFSNIDPGKYDIEVSFVGLQTQRVTDVIVFAGKSNKLDVKMSSGGVNLDEIVVTSYKVPLIQQDNTTSGGTITGDQIRQLPTRNINALAANTAGLASQDEGDDVTVKGSRKESTFYFVDNVRVFGALPPESEIDQLQVITGGIEAQYGDVTGGIISIITKGPSAAFSGGVEAETS
ncbi:MAG TPA: carboxypeptidase-like regulatory domain-containing protein, partial [Saprospiraceae bacterium]|nr:carboxypeptidase-like regulatory domain-containing protein [Saprospiraceae bacterium]